MREAVSCVHLREVESLVAVAVDVVLRFAGGEVEDVENWLIAAVVAPEEAAHCSRVYLSGLCPGLRVWAVVEGEYRY